MSTRIPVGNITPGMLLAEPILNKHQKVIFQIGTNLTEYHMTFFKNSGIQFVVIDHNEERVDSTPNSDMRALAIQHVDKRIRWKPCNPLEEEIYRLAIQRAEHSLLERRSK